MNNQLNIPLESTRQKYWRVLEIIAASVAIIIFGWFLNRAVQSAFRHSTVPVDSELAIFIYKNAATEQLLRDHLQGLSAIPGGPWSLRTALDLSSKGIILIRSNDNFSLVIDRPINEMVTLAPSFDLQATILENSTLISTVEIRSSETESINLLSSGLLHPSIAGVIVNNDEKISISYSKHDDRLLMHGARLLETPLGGLAGSADDLAVAAGFSSSIADSTFGTLPLIFPGLSYLVSKARSHGMSLLLSHNASDNPVFVIHWKSQANDQSDFLALGRDLLASLSFQIASLQLLDGTQANELISPTPEILERKEGDFIFTDLTTASGKVRIIRGPNSVTATNELSSELQVTAPFSTACASTALALIRPQKITKQQISYTYHQSSIWQMPWDLKEIAQTDGGIRLCW